jgi:hypothetical protein
LTALGAGPARAEGGQFGLGLGYSARADHAFVTGEMVFPADARVRVALGVEYFSADRVRHFTTNADVLVYGSLRRINRRLQGWAGGGVGLLSRDPIGEGRATTRDAQLNLVAGAGFEGQLAPYVQVRLAARRFSYVIGLRLDI